MLNFDEKYKSYLDESNRAVDEFCANLDCMPEKFAESLKYSLQIGGKRIRPVLMYAVGDVLGVEHEKLKNFALALELIHTYSLIHDDLPEMDNDDFRRGKPSNHKVFGVGSAVLAGDGLLNTAYQILFRECPKGAQYVAAADYICSCAGVYGMIAGQFADLQHEHDNEYDEDTLNFIYENKTSKLIMAAVLTPSILCNAKYYAELKKFGSDLGYLFQLVDDILDAEGSFDELGKSVGKDKQEEKYTAISVYGAEASKLRADILATQCKIMIEGMGGDEFLIELVDFIRSRKK